jgi:hypothetical protein
MSETSLELTEETMKELAPPCETPNDKCRSKYSEPATWICSHENSKGGCTILLCEPCKNHEEKAFMQRDAITGLMALMGAPAFAEYKCFHCGEMFTHAQVIFRRI